MVAICGLVPVREHQLDESALIEAQYPLLHDTSRVIAYLFLRNQATVGGNLAHADPANDYPATMLVYDAAVTARGPNGTRVIAIRTTSSWGCSRTASCRRRS